MKAYFDYCKDLLGRMIACNTTNPDGKEEALASLLCDEMQKMEHCHCALPDVVLICI